MYRYNPNRSRYAPRDKMRELMGWCALSNVHDVQIRCRVVVILPALTVSCFRLGYLWPDEYWPIVAQRTVKEPYF